MATNLQFGNRGQSHSFPELSKTRDQQNQLEDKGTETPKCIKTSTGRNILEEIKSHYGKHCVQRKGRKGFK